MLMTVMSEKIYMHPTAAKVLFLCVLRTLTPEVCADIIATDGDIPANMSAGGTELNPAEYILGFSGKFDRDFFEPVYVGKNSSWNQLLVRNASVLDVDGGSSFIGYAGSGSAVVTGNGSAWSTSNSLYVGYYFGSSGHGALSIEAGGSVSSGSSATIASGSGSDGSVTVSGMGSTLTVGEFSYDELRIGGGSMATGVLRVENGGTVINSGSSRIGTSSPQASGMVTVSGEGSSWSTGNELYVGSSGTGELRIESGGSVTGRSTIGSESGSHGTVVVTGSGSEWSDTAGLVVGRYGTGALQVEAGGSVSSTSSTIGLFDGASAAVLLTGNDSTWDIGGLSSSALTIGYEADNGNLTIEDGALVTLNGDLVISSQAGATDNFLRLNEGYFAWQGNNLTELATLLVDGKIQVWDMEAEAWMNAYGSKYFSYGYFATDQEAFDFSGYEGLGDYTILTSTVPEPQTAALMISVLGLSYCLLLRSRKA